MRRHRAAQAWRRLGYDALVVATGADPVRPPVPGLDMITCSRSGHWTRRSGCGGSWRAAWSARALVVGAGYIGLETAEALVCVGAEVEVIEALPRVLGRVDEPSPRWPRPSPTAM